MDGHYRGQSENAHHIIIKYSLEWTASVHTFWGWFFFVAPILGASKRIVLDYRCTHDTLQKDTGIRERKRVPTRFTSVFLQAFRFAAEHYLRTFWSEQSRIHDKNRIVVAASEYPVGKGGGGHKQSWPVQSRLNKRSTGKKWAPKTLVMSRHREMCSATITVRPRGMREP